MKTTPLFVVVLASVGLASCTTPDGRIQPPDPIGRAIFNAIDPGPRNAPPPPPPSGPSQDADYLRQSSTAPVPRGVSNPVWIDGAWGVNPQGQRVWVPGHWASTN